MSHTGNYPQQSPSVSLFVATKTGSLLGKLQCRKSCAIYNCSAHSCAIVALLCETLRNSAIFMPRMALLVYNVNAWSAPSAHLVPQQCIIGHSCAMCSLCYLKSSGAWSTSCFYKHILPPLSAVVCFSPSFLFSSYPIDKK